jgi:hypothetical protein
MKSLLTAGLVVFSFLLAAPLEAKQLSNVNNKIGRFTLAISATSEEWVSTRLKVYPGDILLIRATGTISVGGFLGKTDPDGTATGVGRLKLKIGDSTVESVGSIKYVPVTVAGTAMLRIEDSNYRDNSGEFSVDVIRIPEKIIPKSIPVTSK